MTRLFTPDLVPGSIYPGNMHDETRADMALTDDDNRLFYEAKAADAPAVVIDQNTGTAWVVRGNQPCGAGCRCAAIARVAESATCRHCQHTIFIDPAGGWFAPDAGYDREGGDGVWLDSCPDNHETREAPHEPEED